MKPPVRIGIGYDSHRFIEGRPLVMGGLIIPHIMGLEGHSDADVLLHAIADSILGAAGMGDIGKHFPDTEEKYKDIKSTKILSETVIKIVKKGYRIGNVDAIIIAEIPRMEPHIIKMREKIARILLAETDEISIKATTNEKMGFVGREEGIAAMATTLLYTDHGTVV